MPDPFQYTFGHAAGRAEAPQVEMTWRSGGTGPGQSSAFIGSQYPGLGGATGGDGCRAVSRETLRAIGELRSRRHPLFVDVLLGDRPLKEKSIAAMFLLLYNNKPLQVDVPLDATPEQVERVSETWQAHYEAERGEYQVSLLCKLWNIVADTQHAVHMARRCAVRSPSASNRPVNR